VFAHSVTWAVVCRRPAFFIFSCFWDSTGLAAFAAAAARSATAEQAAAATATALLPTSLVVLLRLRDWAQ